MVSTKHNSKKTDRFLKSTRRPKPDRRWTLLFIGNHGRTITLKRFKGMVLFTFLILCVAIAAAAGLFLWNQNIIREKLKIESDLGTLIKELTDLRHEKDILMTRLVLAESKVEQDPAGAPQEQLVEEATDQEKEDPGEEEQTAEPEVETTEAPAQKPAEPRENNEPSESALSVAIENFKISNSSGGNRLRIQFKIKNTSPNSQRVEGHAIVVLKGDELKKSSWMAIPGMPLVEGKPSGRHRGYAFEINYFRTMRFSTASPLYPEKYQTASVYVFASSGELLLEQDFAVELPVTEKQP